MIRDVEDEIFVGGNFRRQPHLLFHGELMLSKGTLSVKERERDERELACARVHLKVSARECVGERVRLRR